jgi:hypothetical protein
VLRQGVLTDLVGSLKGDEHRLRHDREAGAGGDAGDHALVGRELEASCLA